MSNIIYLYLKTHNETGLKYLGITKQDPYKYMGSGIRWRNHLSKHGNNVTTEIIFQSDNKSEIKQKGIATSKQFDIVESDEFANLKIEEGDGGFDHINDGSENHINRCRAGGKKAVIKMNEFLKNNPEKRVIPNCCGMKHSPETIEKMKKARAGMGTGSANSQFGTVWCVKENADTMEQRKKFKLDNIPKGWISCKEFRENKKDKNNSAYGRSWYNDGLTNYFLKRDDPKIKDLDLEKRRIQ